MKNEKCKNCGLELAFESYERKWLHLWKEEGTFFVEEVSPKGCTHPAPKEGEYQ